MKQLININLIFLKLPFLASLIVIRLGMPELLMVHRVLLVAVNAVLAHLTVVNLVGVEREALRRLFRFDRHLVDV